MNKNLTKCGLQNKNKQKNDYVSSFRWLKQDDRFFCELLSWSNRVVLVLTRTGQ